MRILIISHNVINDTSNMGKTILNYFRGMKDVEFSQFYIHSEVPNNSDICTNYYRFTDVDVLKSILIRTHIGSRFYENDIDKGLDFTRVDEGKLKQIYTKGRRRTPLMYILRNAIWCLGKWYSDDLKQWVKEFNPDVIFFASGDYAFMYSIAYRISSDFSCPLVVACFDDYYIFNTNHNSFLGRMQYKFFMKTVMKTMRQSKLIVTICEAMKKEYMELFHKKSIVLYTAANNEQLNFKDEGRQISYIGGLGVNRYKQLIAIGKALQKIEKQGVPKYVDVYSTDTSEEILSQMSETNGIRFHGAIAGKEADEVLENSILAIHTESFEKDMIERVKYSVSTKIAELCSRGPCILAYGPLGVASIDYLKDNNAAYVITFEEELERGLIEICTNKRLREKIMNHARNLAKQNHNARNNVRFLREKIEKII